MRQQDDAVISYRVPVTVDCSTALKKCISLANHKHLYSTNSQESPYFIHAFVFYYKEDDVSITQHEFLITVTVKEFSNQTDVVIHRSPYMNASFVNILVVRKKPKAHAKGVCETQEFHFPVPFVKAQHKPQSD